MNNTIQLTHRSLLFSCFTDCIKLIKLFFCSTSYPFAPIIIGIFCLFLSTVTMANPTYKVFFDGGGVNESSIVASNGAPELPEGICGMRISGAALLYEFYWAEYNANGLGAAMPEPPWGPPSSATYDFPDEALETVIEFTGPLGENCEDEWVFHLPLTGAWPTWANGTPSEAGALVFQVIPNDIEWLNSGFQIWEPPGNDPGESKDPEYVSFCDIWPDLCIEPSFTDELPCIPDISCNSTTQTDRLTLRLEKLVQIAIHELNSVSQDKQVAHFEKASAAVKVALDESQSLMKIKFLSDQQASRVKGDFGIAEVSLRSCLNRIEKIRDDSLATDYTSNSTKDAIQTAITHCKSAIDSLIAARDKVRRISINSESVKQK